MVVCRTLRAKSRNLHLAFPLIPNGRAPTALLLPMGKPLPLAIENRMLVTALDLADIRARCGLGHRPDWDPLLVHGLCRDNLVRTTSAHTRNKITACVEAAERFLCDESSCDPVPPRELIMQYVKSPSPETLDIIYPSLVKAMLQCREGGVREESGEEEEGRGEEGKGEGDEAFEYNGEGEERGKEEGEGEGDEEVGDDEGNGDLRDDGSGEKEWRNKRTKTGSEERGERVKGREKATERQRGGEWFW